MSRMEAWGPEKILSGPGLSKPYVSRVQTPMKLPHIFLRFAGENASGLCREPIQNRVEWLLQSGHRSSDVCRRFAGLHWRFPKNLALLLD